MKTLFVFNSESGDAKAVTQRQLSKELKVRKQEALRILDSRQNCYVLYALKRNNEGHAEYHMMPCTLYPDRKFEAVFSEQTNFTPIAVHG